MRVRLAWIGIIVITCVLLFLGVQVYTLWNEPPPPPSEGFTVAELIGDIQIKACPAKTNQFTDTGGNVLCCKADLVGNVCPSGQLACTLSESTTIPTCSAYVESILDVKGADLCPPTLPNYYENGPTRGCTAGKRTTDGSAPANSADKQCTLYANEKDEQSKLDSCTNLRMLEKTKCFTTNVNESKTLVGWSDLPALVSCSYKDTSSHMPRSCYSDESLYRYMENIVSRGWATKEWRSTWNPYAKTYWSSKHQKVYIDKTKSVEDLANDPIA